MAEYIERDSAAAFAYNCGAVYVSNRLSDKNAFPAADVAPVKHGRYKTSDWLDEWYDYYFICMECGSRFMIIDEHRDLISPNCCPVCMARLDGEK